MIAHLSWQWMIINILWEYGVLIKTDSTILLLKDEPVHVCLSGSSWTIVLPIEMAQYDIIMSVQAYAAALTWRCWEPLGSVIGAWPC